MRSKRMRVSLPVRTEVGSSMMRSSTLKEVALAISTICFCAILRSRTFRPGWIFSPSRSRSAAASSFILRKSISPDLARGSRHRKMFCATVSSSSRFSSWWIMDTPSSCICLGVAPRWIDLAVEHHLAGVLGVDAGQDLHQGGLAGAVLAAQPHDLAALQGEVDARAAPPRRRSSCRCPACAGWSWDPAPRADRWWWRRPTSWVPPCYVCFSASASFPFCFRISFSSSVYSFSCVAQPTGVCRIRNSMQLSQPVHQSISSSLPGCQLGGDERIGQGLAAQGHHVADAGADVLGAPSR